MITVEHENWLMGGVLKEISVYNYTSKKEILVVTHSMSRSLQLISSSTYIGIWRVKKLHKTNSIKLN